MWGLDHNACNLGVKNVVELLSVVARNIQASSSHIEANYALEVRVVSVHEELRGLCKAYNPTSWA